MNALRIIELAERLVTLPDCHRPGRIDRTARVPIVYVQPGHRGFRPDYVVEAPPLRYDQSQYHSESCGTAVCIAGLARIMAIEDGLEVPLVRQGDLYPPRMAPDGGWPEWLAERLGIRYSRASALCIANPDLRGWGVGGPPTAQEGAWAVVNLLAHPERGPWEGVGLGDSPVPTTPHRWDALRVAYSGYERRKD